ncbi:hypothetical protein N0V90_002938 [Kalmusia sp. IMI 367209]|nr:hypothetical protein N0V90_002938 [Kalmusia sp. IMI 367209]
MGSLYEPSIRSSSVSVISRGKSKRFTTLSGWREIGQGAYAMGSSNIRMFSFRHQFDPEHFRDDGFDFTQTLERPAETIGKVECLVPYRRSSEGTIGKAIGSLRDPKCGFTKKEKEITPDEPYSAYTVKEKWTLVAIVGAAGCFPILTFNIYLPALGRAATVRVLHRDQDVFANSFQDLQVGAEAINLTIMTYLIVQGVVPLLWGPLSDCLGRRSVYLYTIILYHISCIILSFSPSFAVLLVFRGIQAVTITSAASIGYAIIHDIEIPTERDNFYDFIQGVRNGTLLLAPIVGGLTSMWANFRCLFVVLFALSLALLVAIAFLLPETLRSIAGNGTRPLTGIHQPLVWRCKIFGKPAHVDESLQPAARLALPSARKFLGPLRLLGEKDILFSLLFSGMIFAIWTVVTITTASLFKRAFALNEALLGLAFLPNFVGAIAGSALIGNLLDDDFKRACLTYKRAHSLPPTTTVCRLSLPADFPTGHMRLVRLPALVITFVITLSFYGYSLAYLNLTSLGGWICIPLFLQFLISASAHAICGVHQTLISELWSNDGSNAASVTSNLVRSLLAAIGVAVVQKILECIGSGPTFLALGLVVLVLVPLPIMQWFWGEAWRQARRERIDGSVDTPSFSTKV